MGTVAPTGRSLGKEIFRDKAWDHHLCKRGRQPRAEFDDAELY